jgi:hypothetical protein
MTDGEQQYAIEEAKHQAMKAADVAVTAVSRGSVSRVRPPSEIIE